MHRDVRDLFVFVAIQFAIFGSWMTAGRQISPDHFAVWAIVCLFALNAVAKALWRGHFLWRRVSWTYLILSFVLWTAIVLFISDGSILGYWTLPSVALLVALSFVLQYTIGPFARDDERGANS